MVFSLFGKGKKKKKEQPRSKYYDDYKILDTEKRIQKIKNKNWSKYLQYLINNHTKGEIKKLFYKELKKMPKSYEARNNEVTHKFNYSLRSSHDSSFEDAINVYEEIKDINVETAFRLLKMVAYLHHFEKDIGGNYESAFFIQTYTLTQVARDNDGVAKLFNLKIK